MPDIITAAICKGLEERGINGVLAYSRPPKRKGFLPKRAYVYDEHFDCYLCPKDQPLKYRTTTREGYREYVSKPKVCKACELLGKCTQSSTHIKVVTHHIWQHHKDQVDEHRYFEWGKQIYKRRNETVERSFADSKQLHGHRYARLRGISKVREQCLLAAACQNMKKIALILSRRSKRPSGGQISMLLVACIKGLWPNKVSSWRQMLQTERSQFINRKQNQAA